MIRVLSIVVFLITPVAVRGAVSTTQPAATAPTDAISAAAWDADNRRLLNFADQIEQMCDEVARDKRPVGTRAISPAATRPATTQPTKRWGQLSADIAPKILNVKLRKDVTQQLRRLAGLHGVKFKGENRVGSPRLGYCVGDPVGLIDEQLAESAQLTGEVDGKSSYRWVTSFTDEDGNFVATITVNATAEEGKLLSVQWNEPAVRQTGQRKVTIRNSRATRGSTSGAR